jgi:vacuolar-type H+-ATPase subunit I/STV1
MSPPSLTPAAARGARERQASRPGKDAFKVLYWVAAIPISILLAGYATWWIISRYPVPDDDAINLALFLSFLIGFLDLMLLGGLLVSGRPENRHPGMMALLLAGGILFAAIVGLLTWGTGWLLKGRPWLPEAFIPTMALLYLAYILWGRRKSRASSA